MDGPAHHRLPIGFGAIGEIGRAIIQNRRIIQGPLDGIPGTDDHARDRCFSYPGDGRLTAGEREATSLIHGRHKPLEYRQERLIALDLDEEFRAFHGRIHKRGHHLQAPRNTAEKIGRPNEEIEQ